MAGSRHVVPLEVEAYGTEQTVLLKTVLLMYMYRPGQLPGKALVISGELQAGGII